MSVSTALAWVSTLLTSPMTSMVRASVATAPPFSSEKASSRSPVSEVSVTRPGCTPMSNVGGWKSSASRTRRKVALGARRGGASIVAHCTRDSPAPLRLSTPLVTSSSWPAPSVTTRARPCSPSVAEATTVSGTPTRANCERWTPPAS